MKKILANNEKTSRVYNSYTEAKDDFGISMYDLRQAVHDGTAVRDKDGVLYWFDELEEDEDE